VSVALFCTIFEIFGVEEYLDLDIRIRGHSLCEFMYDLYIVELYRPGDIFVADSMALSSFTSIELAPEKATRVKLSVTVVQDGSRSSKLIESRYATSY